MKSFIFMLISLLLSHTLTGHDVVIPERSMNTRGQLRRLAPPPGGKPPPKKPPGKKKKPTTNTAEEGASPPTSSNSRGSSSNSRGSSANANERGSAPASSRNEQATSNNRGKTSPKKKPLKRSEELRIQREKAAQRAIAEGKKPKKRGGYSEEVELNNRERVKQKRYASLDESYNNGFDAVRLDPNTPVRGRRNASEFDPISDSEYFRYHDKVLDDFLDYNHQYHEADRSYMRKELIRKEMRMTDNLLDLVDYERARNPSREAQEAWTERERMYDRDYESLRNQYHVENNELKLLLESMEELSVNVEIARAQDGWDPAEYLPPRQYERKKWETDEQWEARKKDWEDSDNNSDNN